MPAAVNRTTPRLVDAPVRWFGPPWHARCLLCGEAGRGGHDLCGACAGQLPWNLDACCRCALPLPRASAPGPCGACLRNPPPLSDVRAACVYAFPLDRLLPRFKFHHDLAAGRLLAQLMAAAFGPLAPPACLVPIPLHRARLRSRGYDQALELARPLAQALALPLRRDLLQRARATAPQSRLDAGQRSHNLRGAFTAHGGRACPAHVTLVDDVMTTGATLHAAARCLRAAGVARVDAWICARAL